MAYGHSNPTMAYGYPEQGHPRTHDGMIIPQFHPVPGFQLDHPSAAAWIKGQHDLQIPASHRGIRIICRVADGRRPNLGAPD